MFIFIGFIIAKSKKSQTIKSMIKIIKNFIMFNVCILS
ncbi:hypothetical protein HFN_1159 [Helicobacter fennelliae MRY12-0050]|uniref:Uncharacterized protein n=1 Tax=Helicobacter fennelliae MRY12-0050 TaxID=1325130 RepID=T1CSW8_9HELI|nr:hypothetical protein HFN_1159 [Helicobacter fennelliae MRY12-0050]